MKRALYRKIEFWTDIETVWSKLEAGWDWLGVSEEGEYVVGFPGRVSEAPLSAAITIREPGAEEGRHGVRIEARREAPRQRWYASEERARSEFARIVAELRAPGEPRPVLALVQRIEAGEAVEHAFVVGPAR